MEYIAAVARPGDTVVIGITRQLSDDEFYELSVNWQEQVGEEIGLAVVDGVTSMVVAKADDDDEFDKEFPA